MIVVDASAVIELLLRTEIGEEVEPYVLGGGTSLHAPELLDYEVLSALRRRELRGQIGSARAAEALGDLRAIPIELHPTRPLHERAWSLRRNLTAADAIYAALAEALGASLLTTDAPLAPQRHPPHCRRGTGTLIDPPCPTPDDLRGALKRLPSRE